MEKKIKTQLGEDNYTDQQMWDVHASALKVDENDEVADFENNLKIAFVQERKPMLGYTYEIVHYAALCNEIEMAGFENVPIKTAQNVTNAASRLIIILEKYQELPQILDSMLEQLVTPLITLIKLWVRKQTANKVYGIHDGVKLCFSVLSQLIKVRGHKTVVKFFPHEVSDMEPVTEMLANSQTASEFHVPYVLLLWLSIIVMVPFDLTTIDSASSSQVVLVQRIVNIAKQWLDNSGKLRDAASLMLAKLVTRPDVVKQGETDKLLDYLVAQYSENINQTGKQLLVSGILVTLVQIFKIGHRDDLLSRASKVLDAILKTQSDNPQMQKSSFIKKARVNLAQRIGCIFLKPRVAKWRYQRGSRSLASNLSQAGILTSSNEPAQNTTQPEDEDDDLTEEQYEQLEFIIETLMCGLSDEDNIVRWSAAKGVGRITMRLG